MRFSVLSLAIIAALAACHDDEPKKSAAKTSAAICVEGGALLLAATNECSCPETQRWNGTRCEGGTALVGNSKGTAAAEAARAAAHAEASAPRHDKDLSVKSPVAVAGMPTDKDTGVKPAVDAAAPHAAPELAAALPKAVQNAVAAEGDAASGAKVTPNPDKQPASRGGNLGEACKAAGAHFDAKDNYCHCPGGDVLIGSTCRSFAGQVNELACTGVQRPGHWFKGRCDCVEGKDFIPGRGGCVARRSTLAVTARRICESSINRGKWDAHRGRCDCGSDRVWSAALCQVSAAIPSREVCESGSNLGKWDKDRRRCDCPGGRVWIDQSCRLAGSVDPLAACVSEANGGRWIAAENRCDCPAYAGRAPRWDARQKVCN